MSFMILRDPLFKWFFLAGVVVFFLCFLIEYQVRRRSKRKAEDNANRDQCQDHFK